MKLNRLVLPLTLALITTLASTGCKHTNTPKVTNLGHPAQTGPTTESDLNTKPITQPDNTPIATPTPQPPYAGGPLGTTTNWDPRGMNQDREKLAAYTVHFKFDSAVVEASEQVNVASVAAALKSDANAKLLIEGHCDERGTEEYNRALGERRALALREELAKAGIEADSVRTISYGKDKPVDPGHDESAWAKNRRGEFIWCTPKAPVQ
ncbi:MAG: OmpA family protein [Verrucomicrobiota bacterium]|jgi:peptidoglycan-associated lipoprotein